MIGGAVESIGVAALLGFSVVVLCDFVLANAVYIVIHLAALFKLRRLMQERTFRLVRFSSWRSPSGRSCRGCRC